MKIGELAKLTDCQVETIRYYEKENLLPEPARSEGNYRLYTQAHVERLTFIRNCRSLDMTLEEIRSLLSLRAYPPRQGADRRVAGIAGPVAGPAPALWRRAGDRPVRDPPAPGSQWQRGADRSRTLTCGQEPRPLEPGADQTAIGAVSGAWCW